MIEIEKYAQAAASTARTPPNSPARRAALEMENAARVAAEQFVRGLEAERDALRAELDDAEVWRGLAIQFDAHRLQALWHLRALISSAGHADTASAFLAAPPLAGHAVVKERDELRARLDAAAGQEPVKWDVPGFGVVDSLDEAPAKFLPPATAPTPLYAAPVPAQAVPSVYLVATGMTHDGQDLYTRHDAPVPMTDNEHLYAAAPEAARAHSDDQAVNNFACAMRRKLAMSRAKGRGGWDDPAQCGVETLARMLVEHVRKGDPVDVANFAMMLHQRGAATATLADAARAEPVPISDERIDAIADLVIKGMPDGIRGFVRGWGWQHFARELLDVCAGHYRAQAVPDGWRLAPADPTPEMIEAAGNAMQAGCSAEGVARDVMAAAPKAAR